MKVKIEHFIIWEVNSLQNLGPVSERLQNCLSSDVNFDQINITDRQKDDYVYNMLETPYILIKMESFVVLEKLHLQNLGQLWDEHMHK